jgi:hypothetical protein
MRRNDLITLRKSRANRLARKHDLVLRLQNGIRLERAIHGSDYFVLSCHAGTGSWLFAVSSRFVPTAFCR